MASTSMISGLASGIDWKSMVSQLIAVDSQPINAKKTEQSNYQAQLKEWQSFNTMLLSLNSSAQDLADPDGFNMFTSSMTSDNSNVDAADLLSIDTTSSASQGTYTIKVNNVATAQKLSSSSFSSYSDAVGSSYAGDIVINGKVISINATDGLDDIRNRINNANSGTTPTGVTASIISYGSNDYRLILTSNNTGKSGISLQDGSANDILEQFGWKDNTPSLKNSITGGAQSDSFSSTTQDIKSLLGLSTTQSGTVQIGSESVDIDLSTDSLDTIKSKIDALTNVSASLVTDTENGITKYKLQIDGTQTFADNQNILETLGVLTKGVSDAQGTSSANTMTTSGNNITADTLLSDIDGYYSWTSGDSIDITGTDHTGNTVSNTFSIGSSSTVQDLLSDIQTTFGNVSARVTSDGTIEVDDMQTGGSSLSVGLTSNVGSGSLDWGAFSAVDIIRKREIVAGSDASVTVDGIETTSSDNSIDNVLSGITLNLKDADASTTVTLNVDRNISGITDKINTFVSAYNKVSSYINTQQSYDTDQNKPGGVLFGDGTLSSVKSDLSSILVQPVWGVSSGFSILGLVGINLDNDGKLSVDSSKLGGFLGTNFYDVQQLFSTTGSSDSGTMEYVSSTKDTQAGDYEVNITQAATKNSTTSDTAVSGTLASDENLTLTDSGKTANITLTAGMTISDIINAVNTELDTVYTQTLAGNTAVTAGASPVTSATTWGSIDGANLVNGDTINFTGTTRNGTNVAGSYTINDTGTDTIQGLLSEIESTLGDVSATIDSSGKLQIMDNSEGASNLSFSLDYTQTTNQVDIFGSVLTSNSGGQEGRYAMDITASNDGSDHLQLINDNYGSSYNFTVAENTDSGLWNNSMSTPVTVNNGLDVAGTINGEAATGTGQNLTGNSGDTNIDSLVIKYTGSATGIIGNIKLTQGVAALFNNALFSITDPYEGYIGVKENSLSDQISNIDDNISTMQAHLDQKQQALTNQFVNMETAISKIQSQSQWLTSQINSLG